MSASVKLNRTNTETTGTRSNVPRTSKVAPRLEGVLVVGGPGIQTRKFLPLIFYVTLAVSSSLWASVSSSWREVDSPCPVCYMGDLGVSRGHENRESWWVPEHTRVTWIKGR